jgi:methyl-accepting chemotaxis protein
LGLKLSAVATLGIGFVFAAQLAALGVLEPDPELVRQLFLAGAPLVFVAALVVHWWVSRLLAPFQELRQSIERLQAGVWLAPAVSATEDEVGAAVGSIEALRRSLLKTRQALRGASNGLEEAMRRIEGRLGSLLEVTRSELDSLEGSGSRLDGVSRAAPALAVAAGRLHATTEDHSAAVRSMVAGIEAIAASAESLNQSVDEAASSIEQIAASIQQVAASTGRLSGSMDEAVAVISGIETSLRRVEHDTREASHLSQQLSQEAVRGGATIRKTIEGMRRVRRSVQQTAKVVRTLGGRSKEIGEILQGIEEIAGQTNLLAINAAIIAAQAGDQGKGFALVAEEIRDLAERTTASTKEIDTLIKTVQRESTQAVDAMEEGLASVEEGVVLGSNAGAALERILERAEGSASTSRATAEAIQEQTFGFKRVAQELENIRSMVIQINLATQAQAQASMLLTRATREMKDYTEHVTRSTAEQVQRAAELGADTAGLERESRALYEAMLPQRESIEAIAAGFLRLQSAVSSRLDRFSSLEEAMSDLAAARSDLLAAIGRLGMLTDERQGPGI